MMRLTETPDFLVVHDERIKELIKEYHITEEKLIEYKTIFSRFDDNNDGDISIEELAAALKGEDITPAELNEMMREVDDNENGTIQFVEFLKMMARKHEKEARILKAFSYFDKENTGFISTVDLRNIMKRHAEILTTDQIDDMVYEADIDEDGYINYHEFVKMLMSAK